MVPSADPGPSLRDAVVSYVLAALFFPSSGGYLDASPESRYRKEHHKKRDREGSTRDNKWPIHARISNRPRGKVAGDTGPPISEQPNVHHHVTDHPGNE